MDPLGKLSMLVDDMYDTPTYQTKEEEAVCISSVGCWLNYAVIWSRDVFVELNLPKGLSMISLPVIPDNLVASVLFPEAEKIFSFDDIFGYSQIVVHR